MVAKTGTQKKKKTNIYLLSFLFKNIPPPKKNDGSSSLQKNKNQYIQENIRIGTSSYKHATYKKINVKAI